MHTLLLFLVTSVIIIILFLLIGFSHATRKWLQQYRAVFTKRAIHFKRFYIGAVCQLLPLFIIICSLVICETLVSQYDNEDSLHLTLETTSLTDNRTIFHAEFINQSLPLEVETKHYACFGLIIFCLFL